MSFKVGPLLKTFKVGSVGIATDLKSYSITVNNEELDTSTLTAYGKRTQAGQGQVEISFTANGQSTGACATKLAAKDLTALSIGGTSFINTFTSVSVNLEATHDEVSPANAAFKQHQTTQFDITADCEVMVPTASTLAWYTILTDPAASQNLVFSVTINGETTALPMVATNFEYTGEGQAVNKAKLTLKGQAPCTGNYPTTASGTSLIASYLADPITARNFEFESAASNAEIMDVNTVLNSMSFSVERGQIIEYSFTLMSTGNPAQSIS